MREKGIHRLIRRWDTLFALAACLILASCIGNERADVMKIQTRSLKKEKAAFSGIPEELASLGSGSLGYNYWVEGTIENSAEFDAGNVVIVFHCMDGSEQRKLMADLPIVNANELVPFKTRVLPTTRTLVLLDREPEIKFEWRD